MACPANFDTRAPQTWGRWVKSLEKFVASAAHLVDPVQKEAILLYVAGPDVQDIFDTMVVSDPVGDRTVYHRTLSALTDHFSKARAAREDGYEVHYLPAWYGCRRSTIPTRAVDDQEEEDTVGKSPFPTRAVDDENRRPCPTRTVDDAEEKAVCHKTTADNAADPPTRAVDEIVPPATRAVDNAEKPEENADDADPPTRAVDDAEENTDDDNAETPTRAVDEVTPFATPAVDDDDDDFDHEVEENEHECDHEPDSLDERDNADECPLDPDHNVENEKAPADATMKPDDDLDNEQCYDHCDPDLPIKADDAMVSDNDHGKPPDDDDDEAQSCNNDVICPDTESDHDGDPDNGTNSRYHEHDHDADPEHDNEPERPPIHVTDDNAASADEACQPTAIPDDDDAYPHSVTITTMMTSRASDETARHEKPRKPTSPTMTMPRSDRTHAIFERLPLSQAPLSDDDADIERQPPKRDNDFRIRDDSADRVDESIYRDNDVRSDDHIDTIERQMTTSPRTRPSPSRPKPHDPGIRDHD